MYIRGEQVRLDEDESVEDAPSGAKIALFAIAIALIMGALFYGLHNVDINQPTKCPEGHICTKIQ